MFLNRQGVWEAVVALVAVALYARTVGFGWIYDDQMEIVLNSFVHSFRNLPLIFSTTVWAGSGMETYLYRPLPLATYAANHLISGLAPWSYHLVNVLLHAGVSVMVVRVGRLWGLSVLASGLAGFIFAIHPIHVEVVAAIFGRKDLLAAFFTLAMVLLHGPAVAQGGWRTAMPVLAYACAMLSKEVGAVGLVMVAGQDWFLSQDRSQLTRDGRRARLFVAYAATFLAYVLVRNWVTGGVGVPDTFYMDNPLVQAPLGIRIATALALIGKGLALQVLPLAQSPDYSFNAIPLVESPLDPRFLGTLGLLALLGLGLLKGRSRKPALTVAALWYFVAIFPTANLLILVGTIFGERLLFLPSAAFCLVVGLAGAGAIGQRPRLASIMISLWLGALALQTLRYSGAWDSDISLFRTAVISVPNSTKANHKLGEELLRAGELGPSLPFLRRAMEIAPDNQFAAQTLAQARQQVIRRYLPMDPGSHPPTPPPADPEILYLLGQVSRERGDTAQALHHLQAAVELDPEMASAWFSLGRLHLARGDSTGARRALEAFVRNAGTRFPQEVAWAQNALGQLLKTGPR